MNQTNVAALFLSTALRWNLSTALLASKRRTAHLLLFVIAFVITSHSHIARADVCPIDTDDLDGDCVKNVNDNCPATGNSLQEDKDKDKTGDVCDNCPFVDNNQTDNFDGDAYGDACDNCPGTFTIVDQPDPDNDGIGDACDLDDDGDGVDDFACMSTMGCDPANCDPTMNIQCTKTDNCPNFANMGQANSDSDSLGDACDNCAMVTNEAQENDDQNELGNACDDDDDDGIFSPIDNCPGVKTTDQTDSDKDGAGDACDPDDDNDGKPDTDDKCPLDADSEQKDLDCDGYGDACKTNPDSDKDGDGIPDAVEFMMDMNPLSADSDNDHIWDRVEAGVAETCDSPQPPQACTKATPAPMTAPTFPDTDGDGLIDAIDDDSDGDGVLDVLEAGDDDLCTRPNGPSILPYYRDPNSDYDGDGINDKDDKCPFLASPNKEDFDSDGIGDACDPDKDGDGVLNEVDNCEFVPNTNQTDTDKDGIGDACEPKPTTGAGGAGGAPSTGGSGGTDPATGEGGHIAPPKPPALNFGGGLSCQLNAPAPSSPGASSSLAAALLALSLLARRRRARAA